jgi:hypothetical protein
MVDVTSRALVLLFVLCRAFFLPLIFLFAYFLYRFLSSTKRETTDSQDSNLARLNFRIFSTSLDMIRAGHHLPNHAAAGLTACYPSWDASAIVRLSFPHPSSATLALLTNDRLISFYNSFMLCIVNSIVLLTNGINFAVQAVLLVTIGAWADYGTWRCAGATVGPSVGTEWTPSAQTGQIS